MRYLRGARNIWEHVGRRRSRGKERKKVCVCVCVSWRNREKLRVPTVWSLQIRRAARETYMPSPTTKIKTPLGCIFTGACIMQFSARRRTRGHLVCAPRARRERARRVFMRPLNVRARGAEWRCAMVETLRGSFSIIIPSPHPLPRSSAWND